MRTEQIDILDDGRIVLVLHDGRLPRGMSTHEAKLYAHDEFFGDLLDELNIATKGIPDHCVSALYHTKTFLEIQR
jgi:hypothetical protein